MGMIRCSVCPGTHNCIPPDGPAPCDLAFIGEAPGRDEDRKGRVFIGKTGQEYDRGYLPHAGLKRTNVFTINAIGCLPDRPGGKLELKQQKDRDLLYACAEANLYPALRAVQPKLIIPMGAFACHAIDPDINLEIQHGIPLQTSWGSVFPMYHPAGGIHEPKKMLQIRTDWGRLRKYLRGTLQIPTDPFAGREDYRVIITPQDLKHQLAGGEDQDLACDTETIKGGDPFCLTFSTQPGTGNLIKADNLEVLALLQYYLDTWQGSILWHNWMFDEIVVGNMGLNFPAKLIVDTMQRAFHLGNIPQGLKALSYRFLGMEMQDFDDLVTPYSRERVIDYYRLAKLEDWPKPEPIMERSNDGLWKLKKPHGMNTKLKTFFTYLEKNEDKEVFEAWTKNWVDEQAMIEERIGPWPGKCISHVPFEKALHYACLEGGSKVNTGDGKYACIRDIVRSRYSEPIPSYNEETGCIESKAITGWYRIEHETPIDWLSIESDDSYRSNRWGGNGTRYTHDHKILTPAGWTRVDQLNPGDYIYHPTEGLTSTQTQIIIGSLLGDADLPQRNRPNGSAAFRYGHCYQQWDYAIWKMTMIKGPSLTVNVGTREARQITIAGNTSIASEFLAVSTCHHPTIKQLRRLSYPEGTKTVSSWCDSIDALGLAVWYQDDGSIIRGRHGEYSARLHTLGFTPACVAYLRDVLLDRFGLPTSLTTGRKEGQYSIAINRIAADAFFETVAPWMHPTMQYKIPAEWRGKFMSVPVIPEWAGLVKTRIIRVFSNPPALNNRRVTTRQSYCIDVDHTHNFFTQSEIAHNCRDADALLRLWPILKRAARLTRRKPESEWYEAA